MHYIFQSKKLNGQIILTIFFTREDGIYDIHLKSLKHSLLLIFYNAVKPTHYVYFFSYNLC